MKPLRAKHIVLFLVVILAGAFLYAWSLINQGFSARDEPSSLETSLGPGESTQFSFTAKNPGVEGEIALKAIQIYEDGTKSEWTGPEGSRTPAPIVEIKKSGP
jgi:hypothetical protein